jgi:hypothetical protein
MIVAAHCVARAEAGRIRRAALLDAQHRITATCGLPQREP